MSLHSNRAESHLTHTGYDIENGLCTAKIHKPLYIVKDEFLFARNDFI